MSSIAPPIALTTASPSILSPPTTALETEPEPETSTTTTSSSSCATETQPAPTPTMDESAQEKAAAAEKLAFENDSAEAGVHVLRWRIDRTIGQGTYGKVRLGIDPNTGEKVAIKIIEKAALSLPKQINRLQREIRFLRLLHHPHIVKVYDVIETPRFIHIIMEYASGGELFDYIVAHKRVKEREARSFFRQVLSAVDYCHKNAVIHRDLKPENLLLDETKTIKIIDFGFGNNFTVEGLLDTFCGSPFYAAPEMILGKKYEGPEVDMWSLGVILFALLCGHLPFDDENMKELYRKIANGSYTCPDHVMPSARHLISRLITVDPKRRATLPEVMSHPWVNEGYDGAPPNYLPSRPPIKAISHVSAELLQRLAVFGYDSAAVEADFSDPDKQRSDDGHPSPQHDTEGVLGRKCVSKSAPDVTVPDKAAAGKGKRRDSGDNNNPRRTTTTTHHTIPRPSTAASVVQRLSRTATRRASSPDGVVVGHPTLPPTTPKPQSGDASPQPPPSAKTRGGGGQYGGAGGHVHTTSLLAKMAPSAAWTRTKPPAIPLPPTPSEEVKGRVRGNGHGIDSHTHTNSSTPQSSHHHQHQQQPHASWFRRFSIPTATVSPTSSPPPTSSHSLSSPSRRSSLASITTPTPSSSSSSTGGRIRDELRAVSGWLFNVSTTTAKPPAVVLDVVTDVLTRNGVVYAVEELVVLQNNHSHHHHKNNNNNSDSNRTHTETAHLDANANATSVAPSTAHPPLDPHHHKHAKQGPNDAEDVITLFCTAD
ncbi:hypothetical protein PhCBS80983_g02175, partial [Powellomyces hirtus]